MIFICQLLSSKLGSSNTVKRLPGSHIQELFSRKILDDSDGKLLMILIVKQYVLSIDY